MDEGVNYRSQKTMGAERLEGELSCRRGKGVREHGCVGIGVDDVFVSGLG